LTAIQETGLFGFLNVDVSSDGTTLVGKFYDNANGEIKETFTITKSEAATATDDSNSSRSGNNDDGGGGNGGDSESSADDGSSNSIE
jgi:hypothetical protein